MAELSTSTIILCIDDNDGVLEYLRALLERCGYTVLAATSAREGLQIAAVCRVAAVIVDYHMPEMNGHDVAMEIKRLKPNTPIIMVSSDEEIPKHVLKVVDGFVPKDQTPCRLLPLLTRICDGLFAALPEGRITA